MGVEGPFTVVVGRASRLAINPSSCRESRRAKSSSTFSKKEFEKWPVRGTNKKPRIAGLFGVDWGEALVAHFPEGAQEEQHVGGGDLPIAVEVCAAI